MVNYSVLECQQETLRYCSAHTPRNASSIASYLQANVARFYKNSPSTDAVKSLKKHVLDPLLAVGLLVKYTPKDKSTWPASKALVVKASHKPQKLSALYQTNIFYDPETAVLPPVFPKIKPETNLKFHLMLRNFPKPGNFTWGLVNLLLCAADKKQRDQLRLYLYRLPLKHSEISFLEEVLVHGEDYVFDFPMQPSVENAKKFLLGLANIENR